MPLPMLVAGMRKRTRSTALYDHDEQPKRPCNAFCYYMQAQKKTISGFGPVCHMRCEMSASLYLTTDSELLRYTLSYVFSAPSSPLQAYLTTSVPYSIKALEPEARRVVIVQFLTGEHRRVCLLLQIFSANG